MTIEEMEDTLERLGIEVVSTRGSEIQGYCPAHVERTGHEDRNPSWWINSDTGAHICFFMPLQRRTAVLGFLYSKVGL